MTFQLSWLVQFYIRLYCKVSQTEFECVGGLQTAFLRVDSVFGF